jgi:hypothetical protein
MSGSWCGNGNSLGNFSNIHGGMGIDTSIIRDRKELDKHDNNKDYLLKQLMPMLDISDEELKEKDEDWIKSKIRQFKIKMINGQ